MTLTREQLAALAQAIVEEAAPRLPPGVSIAVIATDETGDWVGVGSNCSKEYQDALVWCAAHGKDRIDHFTVEGEGDPGTGVPLGPVDYASAEPPGRYRCADCGAHGVKLWRESEQFATLVRLRCCDCTGRFQDESVADIDESGRVRTMGYTARTDQIGSSLPAVPSPDGRTFWGYTSVPDEAVRWWKSLPNRK